MITCYRLSASGVERLEVAYIVPGLLQAEGVVLVTQDGKLAQATRHPSLRPLPQEDDWWGRFPPAG